MLKRLKIKGLVLAVAMAFAVVTGGVSLAATTGQLILTGIVGQILVLIVNGLPAATGLDLASNQSTPLHVANVTAVSNNPTGFLVSVSSANMAAGGRCASSITPCFFSPTTSEALSFDLYRDTTQLGFSSNTAIFATGAQKSPVAGQDYQAKVAFNGTTVNLAEASDYSETLTFTIIVQ